MVNEFTNLILDLDGTLIGRDQKISSNVFDAINKLKYFININIASGREVAGVIKYARQLEINGPQISDNGAIITDALTKTHVWGNFIGYDVSLNISKDIKKLDVPILATHISATMRHLDFVPKEGFNRISIMDLYVDQADNIVDLLKNRYDLEICKVYLPYNDRWAVDLTNKGINKGHAAFELSKILGVKLSNMIAVGDSYNDISVFKVCGLTIAMGDAPDELKNIADYIAPSVDFDGLAVAIDEFILPKLR
ncbi:MAG: HAD family hydrolase [Dehalococcoidia bacterium]